MEHPEGQVEDVARSIDKLGWGRPITISKDFYILAGHGACLAADGVKYTDVDGSKKLFKSEKVPYKFLNYPNTPNHDDPEAIAYMLADNKLPEQSYWNDGKLKANLEGIKLKHFDVNLTGFDDIQLKEIETKIEEKQFLSGEQTPYKRDEFSSLVDEFKDEKGKCKKDENWFYIEFYGDDEKFEELSELLKDKIVGQGKHELNSEWFYDLVKG